MKKLAHFLKLTSSLLALTALLLTRPALADYEAGLDAAFAGDFELAYREFKAAAEDGLDLAQFNLAILYFSGRGVERDLEQAFYWTQQAAEAGHTEAQYNLGALYYAGDGVEQDREQTVQWYSRAAKSGHPEAAFTLATMYDEADAVERDRVLAYAWASMAVANEREGAEELRQRIERRLNAQQLSAARRQFARWQIE